MSILPSLLPDFGFKTKVFYSGEFCGKTQFTHEQGAGQLHLIRKGLVTLEHDHGNHLDIDVPTLVVYPRPCRHILVTRDAGADLICANIHFKSLESNPLARALPEVIIIPIHENESLNPMLHLLFEEASKHEMHKEEMMDRLCDILLMQVIRFACNTGLMQKSKLAGFSDKNIAAVLSAIHQSPSHPWSLKAMADVASMSRSKFAQHFHDIMGMTPGRYLTQYRMTLAESLLRHTRSVKAAAYAVGYSSQSAFSKAFTARTGMSPMSWLEKATDNMTT
jgi:AraC-like DNA-binding protein